MVSDTFKNKLKNILLLRFRNALYHKTHTRIIFTSLGIVIKEFKSSFTQFFSIKYPFRTSLFSLKYCFLALARILLGRTVRLSYAFTGEDRLIESLLKRPITYNGFYVDVGCNHPKYISNTFLFYRRGWRGICIDANKKLIKKYEFIRPKDKAICALVSDKEGQREFFQFTNNVLSSSERINFSRYELQGQKILSQRWMPTKSLTDILDTCAAPLKFDFLSVDVEEHDLNVLRSLDYEKYSPELIIVEDEDFNIETPRLSPIYVLLTEKGYTLKGVILSNLYFLRNSEMV